MYREMISRYHAISFFLKGRGSATAEFYSRNGWRFTPSKLVRVLEGGACPFLLLRLSVALSNFPELGLRYTSCFSWLMQFQYFRVSDQLVS